MDGPLEIPSAFVWALVMKGNLKYRIEKLGLEKPHEARTLEQRKLYDIGRAPAWKVVRKGHCERPEWANGAFIYCKDEHAMLLQRAVWATPDVQAHHLLA